MPPELSPNLGSFRQQIFWHNSKVFLQFQWNGFKKKFMSVLVVVKGNEYEYGPTLSLVTNIDLSQNKLSGDI
ncbi:hypothetical protein ACS0TY_036656 [Phlomoides rotata]